jgi:hypothetical protein
MALLRCFIFYLIVSAKYMEKSNFVWDIRFSPVNACFAVNLACVAGCGNGKYLSVNPSVFKVGVDRCCALTETSREKEHEVR